MKSGTTTILLVALAAGVLGVVAGLTNDRASLDGFRIAIQGLTAAPLAPPPAGTPIAGNGDPIPVLRLPDLRGKQVALPAAYAGRPLLINVWASWCAPCVQEMPELQRFASQQPANGIQVIGIALDDRSAVASFLERVAVTYPILLEEVGPADASVQLGNAKGLLPYSVLVSADGRLLRRKLGPFAAGEIDGWARID